jgi:hypothetical protein
MKKNLWTFFGLPHRGVGAALLALCAFTPVSRASLYDITFTDGGANVGSGIINVAGGVATSGSFTVTAGTAIGVWTLLSPGADSSFTWDNQVNPASNPFVDNNGLVFGLSGNEVNLFYNSGGTVGSTDYGFWGNIGGNYNPQVFGTATITAVPEPINYALAAFGLIFVGGSASRFYLGRRRSATAS